MAKQEIQLEKSGRILKRIKKEQEKYIKSIYEEVAKWVNAQIERLNFNKETNASDALKLNQLKNLQKEVEGKLKKINEKLEIKIKGNIKNISKEVVEELNTIFGLDGVYANIPDDVVQNIITGKIYNNNWSLSKAIWGDYEAKKKDMNTVIAKGIAENKSTYDIAKDLQKYVDTKAKKDWNWSKVYPTSNKVIDYNAQRLARTLVQHAYQQSLEQSIKYNPYINKVKWHSALIHGRTCELCSSRDGKLFNKNEIPLDHPNGLCTLIPILDKSLEEIGKELDDWANCKKVKNNTKLNKWAKSMGHDLKANKSVLKQDKPIIDKIIKEAD